MWKSGRKSSIRIHVTARPSSSPFSCSSFKDVQALFADDFAPPPARKTSVFHRVRLVNSLLRNWSTRAKCIADVQPRGTAFDSVSSQPDNNLPEQPESRGNLYSERPSQAPIKQYAPSISIPGAEKRIVVYFTSLRVVRSTFEDCRYVRSILRSFRVSIDERDLSMDSGFLPELQQIIGQIELNLPRVFIGGRYIGGAEEIRQLHEAGELKKLVEGLPAAEPGVCDTCGGYMFILCEDCNGSHKIYSEKSGFRTCTACNENGLIRCPSCSHAPL